MYPKISDMTTEIALKLKAHSNLFKFFITIYSIQYKYIKEIKITKQTKSCGEGDNQKRKSTILGMSPIIKI